MSQNVSYELSLYEYQLLSDPQGQIRLLRLLPDRRGTMIYANIDPVDFFETSDMHHYEALSYTWGSDSHGACIHVLQGDETWHVAVTKTLEEALDHLRSESNSRTLWVDAVCINQRDALEKSHQVSRMPEIFANATKVIAWVGPESKDSGVAIDALEETNERVPEDPNSDDLKPLPDHSDWSDMKYDLPFEPFQMTALVRFFERKWFDRLWVWPEIRSKAKNRVLLCGARQMTWERFLHAYRVL